MNTFSLGIDLHGTIDSDPELFLKFLTYCTKYLNINVYIISGPPTEQIKKELSALNLYHIQHYKHIISVVDFIKDQNIKMTQDKNGNWWTDHRIWWSTKAQICTVFNIDVLVDDKIEYKEYFTKWMKCKFILWNSEKLKLVKELIK